MSMTTVIPLNSSRNFLAANRNSILSQMVQSMIKTQKGKNKDTYFLTKNRVLPLNLVQDVA